MKNKEKIETGLGYFLLALFFGIIFYAIVDHSGWIVLGKVVAFTLSSIGLVSIATYLIAKNLK